MEAVMFTFSNRNVEPVLSPELQLDKRANNLKHKSKIEILRLRGRYVDSHPEFEIIQAELNRRERWEHVACTLLITGVVILIGVFLYA